jgi:hypothetical protein
MKNFIKYLLRSLELPEEWEYVWQIIKNLHTLYWFKFYWISIIILFFLGISGGLKVPLEFIFSIMYLFAWKWPTVGFILCLIFIIKEDVH